MSPARGGTGFIILSWGLEAFCLDFVFLLCQRLRSNPVLCAWFLGRSLGKRVHRAPEHGPCPEAAASSCGARKIWGLHPRVSMAGCFCSALTAGARLIGVPPSCPFTSQGLVCSLTERSCVLCVSLLSRVEVLEATPCITLKRESAEVGLLHCTCLCSGHLGKCVPYPVPRSTGITPLHLIAALLCSQGLLVYSFWSLWRYHATAAFYAN